MHRATRRGEAGAPLSDPRDPVFLLPQGPLLCLHVLLPENGKVLPGSENRG
jgi:hypothetical protein